MNNEEKCSLIEHCLRYMNSTKLPTPIPIERSEYIAWRKKASIEPTVDDDDEDAWFELHRLIAEDPRIAWSVLTELAARCQEEQCAQIAAGPLTTFLRMHRDAFAVQIDEELMRNEGFRAAYHWLQ